MPTRSPSGRAGPLVRSELFDVLAQNIPAAVYLCRNDEQLSKLYVSPYVETVTGYPAEEFLSGRVGLRDLQWPDDHEQIRRALDAALEARRPFHLEYRIRHADGGVRWVKELGQGIWDPSGELQFLEGALFDVTDRRTVEEKYTVAFRSSPDALVITSVEDGRIFEVNDSFERLSGHTREEAVGRTTQELGLWYQKEKRSEFLQRLESDGSVRNFEIQTRRKDGTGYIALLSAEILEIHGERCILTVAKDHTEESRARNALQVSEERFSNAFFANPNPAVITTLDDGKILEVNDVLCEMSGYRREDLVGRDGKMLGLWNEDHAREMARLLGERGSVRNLELEARSRSGEVHQLLISAVMVELGGETCVLNVANDVTESRNLEQQLLRAQRLESIGTLAGGIAHDLNNVLTPILMGIKLLRREVPEGAERILSILESNTRRGSELIRQILAFARGVEGERIEVQLRQLVGEVAATVRDTFPKSITLSVVCEGEPWPVMGDPTQLHQVLLNLALNARDAMEEKGTLTLRVLNRELEEGVVEGRPKARPGPWVVLEVEDTGVGMCPEVQEKIFDPFFTTKPRARGTGLGLFSVDAIVTSHEGFIVVDSAPGCGTRVRVFLPARGEGRLEDRGREPRLAARGEGRGVLVVDDEGAVREIITGVLEASGYRTFVAADGVEALDRFKERRAEIDAVLLDMMMPRMDGFETIAVLRRVDPDIPIVCISGMAARRDPRRPPPGTQKLLRKPISPEALLSALEEVTASAESREAGA